MSLHIYQTPSLNNPLRFERMYSNTFGYLERFVVNFIKNDEAAKDILQDTYTLLWENMHNIKNDEKVLPLLRTYATNLMINSIKKLAKETKLNQFLYNKNPLITSTEEIYNLKERVSVYEKTLHGMPHQQQTIFRLTLEDGLSYMEIAERLNLSMHTIKYHLSEARRKLQNQMLN